MTTINITKKKFLLLMAISVILAVISVGGASINRKVAFNNKKSQVLKSVNDKTFAGATDVDPIFNKSVDTSKPFDSPEGLVLYRSNTQLISQKIAIMKQQT